MIPEKISNRGRGYGHVTL